MAEPQHIRITKLDEVVINKIAAGECWLLTMTHSCLDFGQIIQRPANAIKELIENSLDAGSTTITITVKDGGLKILQIQDNGHGINKDDLPLVCERFATSKIKQFEDLETIDTYGFRGEALASISHVAHVTITTKTADSPCAWKYAKMKKKKILIFFIRAIYSDGIMVPAKAGGSSDAKPTAGNTGTQIMIEDLFFNVPIRKKALKGSAEEYNKIIDIITRYAIHNSSVAFTCKKVGSNSADFRSISGTTRDAIRQSYGPAIAKELIDIFHTNTELEFKLDAIVSNANFKMKKMVFLLFINHRSVESSNIKRALENLYAAFLPKNSHAFCYISLEMKPQNVDVNVHPTKKEVMFLNEDKVIEYLCETIKEKLANVNDSRMFTPAVIATPSMKVVPITSIFKPVGPKPAGASYISISQQQTPKKTYEHNLVRTDSRMQTLNSFIKVNPTFKKTAATITEAPNIFTVLQSVKHREQDLLVATHQSDVLNDNYQHTGQNHETAILTTTESIQLPEDNIGNYETKNQQWQSPKRIADVQLSSVLNLRNQVKKNAHQGLTSLFRDHTFVGPVDDRWILVQYQTKLYIMDIEEISREFFYQLVLHGFSNFGIMKLETPCSIKPLIFLALEEENDVNQRLDELQDPEDIATKIIDTLSERREMIAEYFGVVFSDDGAEIQALPVILSGYTPNLAKLPIFLLRLGTEVDWSEEEICFDNFSAELGLFYACEPPVQCETTNQEQSMEESEEAKQQSTFSVEMSDYNWTLEHVVMKSIRQWYLPSKEMNNSKTIVQVVELPELYKVFERC
ncbi:DNA mismatch repair protein [Physocladia obscura]|uniref:DNA mismatch repair protein n=1 Tax=Physocladia obscura TaxID=109957 RepID=A0AAD5XH28_9FUNG|nr:DNA mismatch repair protein [Physocladia obscura]